MWIIWKQIVRKTYFCEKTLAKIWVSWVLQNYSNFLHVLESQNVNYVKAKCSWDIFLWNNSGGPNSFTKNGWPRTSPQRLWRWMFPRLIHAAFNIISYFDEIFNKFAAAKARKLCLWRWIPVKHCRLFQVIDVSRGDGSSKKSRQLSGLCRRTLKVLLCFLFTFLSNRCHLYSYFVYLCCTYLYFLVETAICAA